MERKWEGEKEGGNEGRKRRWGNGEKTGRGKWRKKKKVEEMEEEKEGGEK